MLSTLINEWADFHHFDFFDYEAITEIDKEPYIDKKVKVGGVIVFIDNSDSDTVVIYLKNQGTIKLEVPSEIIKASVKPYKSGVIILAEGILVEDPETNYSNGVKVICQKIKQFSDEFGQYPTHLNIYEGKREIIPPFHDVIAQFENNSRVVVGGRITKIVELSDDHYFYSQPSLIVYLDDGYSKTNSVELTAGPALRLKRNYKLGDVISINATLHILHIPRLREDRQQVIFKFIGTSITKVKNKGNFITFSNVDVYNVLKQRISAFSEDIILNYAHGETVTVGGKISEIVDSKNWHTDTEQEGHFVSLMIDDGVGCMPIEIPHEYFEVMNQKWNLGKGDFVIGTGKVYRMKEKFEDLVQHNDHQIKILCWSFEPME